MKYPINNRKKGRKMYVLKPNFRLPQARTGFWVVYEGTLETVYEIITPKWS